MTRAPKRRRGGLSDSDDDSPPRDVEMDPEKSELASELLWRWAWGELPAVDVQKLSKAAVRDGATHPELSKIAALGSWGACPGHVHRDLTRRFTRHNNMPHPDIIKVPAWDTRELKVVDADCAIFNPHDWVATFCNDYEDDFHELFGIQELHDFWDHVSSRIHGPSKI